jgi:hypothetical protein
MQDEDSRMSTLMDQPFVTLTRRGAPDQNDAVTRAPGTWVLRFPVSFIVGLEYLSFVLIPAVSRPGPPNAFVVTITLVGLGAILATELLIAPFSRLGVGRSRRVPTRAAEGLLLIGLVAFAASSVLGYSSYATQVSAGQFGKLASLFSPFTSWALIGGVLLIYCAHQGDISRRQLLVRLGLAVAFHLTISIFVAAITAPSFLFASSLGVGLVMSRFVRPRWLVVGLLVATLTWPLIWAMRNGTRLDSGLSRAQVAGETAQDSLQFDSPLALAQHVELPEGSIPSALDVLRFGLVPRMIDPGRGYLSTGQVFNRVVGGSERSALSFTLFGDLYVVGSWTLLVVYLVVVSALTGMLFRRRGPFSLVAGVLAVNSLMSLGPTFPDSSAAFLQSLSSLAGAVFFIWLWRVAATSWEPSRAAVRAAGPGRPVPGSSSAS